MWKSQWPCHCHTALGVLHDQIVRYHPLANSHRTVSKDNSIPIFLALPAHDKSNGSHCCREPFHTSNLQIWATKLALKIQTSQHQKLLKSFFKIHVFITQLRITSTRIPQSLLNCIDQTNSKHLECTMAGLGRSLPYVRPAPGDTSTEMTAAVQLVTPGTMRSTLARSPALRRHTAASKASSDITEGACFAATIHTGAHKAACPKFDIFHDIFLGCLNVRHEWNANRKSADRLQSLSIWIRKPTLQNLQDFLVSFHNQLCLFN